MSTYHKQKTVCDVDMCNGCMVCADSCAKGAITVVDGLKSYNAVIDSGKCVNCGQCFKVCPRNSKRSGIYPICWKQGWVNDEAERRKSSSGGFATAIAKAFADSEGPVYSCTFKAGEFIFVKAENSDECDMFRGSKYIKSNPAGVYRNIRDDLRQGKKVLFIGLPCQSAAVQNYVGETLAKELYTIDLICHGSPSPKILERYFSEDFCKKLINVRKLEFRTNTNFNLVEDGVKILPKRVQDRYIMAFLDCLDYTENCYSCEYANVNRISDISLGDSWGSEMPQDEEKKGISLALCQTEKGVRLLKSADLFLEDVNVEAAIAANRQLNSPSVPPAQRECFFKQLEKNVTFNKAVKKAYPIVCLKQDIKMFLIRCGIMKD